jgi:ParB family chromosome partitioning protein
MARDISLPLPSVGDLFTTQEQRDDDKREKVVDIPRSEIDSFPDHPFQVKIDESMMALAESVRNFGIQEPAIVRRKEDGRYEYIAGHRRDMACEIVGCDTMPCIIRNMSRDEAVIAMVDSNLQREEILPSEKAFSYKMKLDALKRQGKRTDLTSVQFEPKSRSNQDLADSSDESVSQIKRYIRLTKLIPPILSMVDEGRIAFGNAVYLSYVPPDKQEILYEFMDANMCTPSTAQAVKMKQFYQDGKLTNEVIESIMAEEKPNQVEQFKISKTRIEHFFSAGTRKKDVEDIIVRALEQYFKREHTRNNNHDLAHDKRDRGMER